MIPSNSICGINDCAKIESLNLMTFTSLSLFVVDFKFAEAIILLFKLFVGPKFGVEHATFRKSDYSKQNIK